MSQIRVENRVENRVRFYKNPLFIKTRFLFKQESANARHFHAHGACARTIDNAAGTPLPP